MIKVKTVDLNNETIQNMNIELSKELESLTKI